MKKNANFDKIEQAYSIAYQVIQDLPDDALEELGGGTEKDLENLLNNIVNESYDVLFGKQIQAASFDYLDRFTASLEETLRCEVFLYFLISVLDDFTLEPQHIEWAEMVQFHRFVELIAARGHGKSYFSTNAYPAWKMYRYKPKGDGIRYDYTLSQLGYIFSASQQLAKEHLRILKETIEKNDVLRQKLYPRGRTQSWSQTEVECANGAILRVRGFTGAARGAHPGYIINDDVLTDNAIFSANERDTNLNTFTGVVIPMVEPGGQILLIGTPMHEDDLLAYVKDLPSWHSREYPAIFPDGDILWPDRFSFKDLRQRREELGPTRFAREYLCRPISNDSSIFPYSILEGATEEMEDVVLVRHKQNYAIQNFDRIIVGCDFAISANVGSDYSVFMVFGVDDSSKTMYLMHVWRDKGKTFAEQIQVLKTIHRTFDPEVMFLEKNQFQVIFSQEAAKQGLPVVEHHTGKNKYDFERGLPSLSVMFENNKIKVPIGDEASKNFAEILFAELSSITHTDKGLRSTSRHDDCAMSCWIASLAARYRGNNKIMDFL